MCVFQKPLSFPHSLCFESLDKAREKFIEVGTRMLRALQPSQDPDCSPSIIALKEIKNICLGKPASRLAKLSPHISDCISKATPYEVVKSGVIQALLEFYSVRKSDLFDNTGCLCLCTILCSENMYTVQSFDWTK